MSKLSHTNSLNYIKRTVKNDVEFIQGIQNSKILSAEVKDLYSSLLHVKNRILTIIKESLPSSNQSVSTPGKLEILNYIEEDVISKSNDITMLKIIHEIENDQMSYIKQILKAKGLPDGIKGKLENIYGIYLKVTYQLNQSRKKSTLNPIVI